MGVGLEPLIHQSNTHSGAGVHTQNNDPSLTCSDGSPAKKVAISNFTLTEKKTERGSEFVAVPKLLNDIVAEVHAAAGDWPRCVGSVPFVDEAESGIRWFFRDRVAGLFAWLKSHFDVKWKTHGDFVSGAQLFSQLEFLAPKYQAVELLPHEPPIEGVYYSGDVPAPGDGLHLNALLDFFRPATEIDRQLIKAALLTVFWGGPPGMRPVFVVTSDDGRGVGKSKVADVLTYIAGGSLDVDAGCDIAELKHRLLSPEGLAKRTATLDNVKSLRFSWAELEKLVTAREFSGKQMYVGEGQRPNYITWFMTLNGVSLGDDMAQRAAIIKVVRGKNSGTWYEELIRFVDEHRAEIIGDVISALRVERQAIRFGRWAAWEHDVLARLPQPNEIQALILERQREANCEQDEAELIEEFFAEQLRSHSFDPAADTVHIPSRIAGEWFGKATGEKVKTVAACKRLTQLASEKQNQTDEGKLKRIQQNPSRTHGRGYLWTGEQATPDDAVNYDLEGRVGATSYRKSWAA